MASEIVNPFTAKPMAFQKHSKLNVNKYLGHKTVSPWTESARWLVINRQQASVGVKNVVYALHVAEAPIYPQTISLLINAFDGTSNMGRLIQELGEWKARDGISLLLYMRHVQTFILTSLRTANILLDSKECQHAVILDLICLCSYVIDILADGNVRKYLGNRKGEDAQGLLNLYQQLLDYPDLGGRVRSRIIRAQIKLSLESKLYPENIGDLGVIHVHGIDSGINGIWTPHSAVFRYESQNQIYAVKILRGISKEDMDEDNLKATLANEDMRFRREALIWLQLSHDNLARFIGVGVIEGQTAFISPWCSNRSLKIFLGKNPTANRIEFIHDISRGLNYIHSLRIAHGDIKCENVLLDENHRAMLTDFGMAYVTRESHIAVSKSNLTAQSGGTRGYLPPEVISGGNVSRQADMWSFASTLYEIFTGSAPFTHLRTHLAYLKAITMKPVPQKPSEEEMKEKGLDEEIWQIMCSCWNNIPGARPSIPKLQVFFAGKACRSAIMDEVEYEEDDKYSMLS